VATVFGFLGLAIPNFLFALVLMYLLFRSFGISPGGLFSPEYEEAAWSLGKIWDLAKHLVVPVVVIGTAGTAGLIRTMRATLLDELGKDYVDTARMKGLAERKLLYKYPVRVAINPILSTLGWLLPFVVSGGTITSIVLNLPTVGPLLFSALLNQDMYLAGSIVLILTTLTLIGTFLSDLLLAWSDPRIRFE
jgi:peptide/nickel transport system permease protein